MTRPSLRSLVASCVALLLVVGAASGGAAAASRANANAYAGSHVTFDTQNDAVVDYAVDGTTVFQSMRVQSQSKAESSGRVSADAGLTSATSIAGSAVTLHSKSSVTASLSFESGAEMSAHDDGQGILVLRSSGESQYVTVNVSSDSSVEEDGASRVVFTTENGTEGAFIVVGEGQVTANDAGNISASLDDDASLVFRAYPNGRDESDAKQEALISNGTAAAEVHVMEDAEGGAQFATDVVSYGQNTTVNVTEAAEGHVQMTVDRSTHRGKVVIASVSDAALDATGDLDVTVDGHAAAHASSYSALKSAIGTDQSKYLVRQQSSGSADASTDVAVAVSHFSARQIEMRPAATDGSTTTESTTSSDTTRTTTTASGSSGSGSSGSGGGAETTSGGAPGFTAGIALTALAAAALLAARRRRD